MKSKIKKLSLSIKQKNALTGYLFFLPWIIGFFVFTLYPIIYSVGISMNELRITTEGITMNYKGLEYYYEALNVDTSFKTNLMNELYFTLCATPIIIVFSLVIALLLNKKYPGCSFFRGVFFLPVIIMSGPIISELLTKYTLNLTGLNPVINQFLTGLPSIISKPVLFALENLVYFLWYAGAQILIFLAGLQKVSSEVYEAASIDGATVWEKFWKITLPFVKPFAMVNTIYTVMELANSASNSVNTKIVSHLLEVGRPYSFSAAMSWIYFGVTLVLLLFVYLVFQGFERRSRG